MIVVVDVTGTEDVTAFVRVEVIIKAEFTKSVPSCYQAYGSEREWLH